MSKTTINPRAAGLAAILATSTAIATVFGDWMSYRVPVPVGLLIFLLILVVLPTGEFIGLIAAWLRHVTPETQRSSDDDDPPP